MKTQHLAAAALAALACASASPALAHAKLEASVPQANAVVTPAPTRIRLQFSERLELPFSKVKLVDNKGALVGASTITVDGANPKVLVATVPALHPGAYRVQWSTVTRDGHKVKGEYPFSVK